MKTQIILLSISLILSGELLAQRPTNQAGQQVQHNKPNGAGRPTTGAQPNQKVGVPNKQEIDPNQINIRPRQGQESPAPRVALNDKQEVDPRQIHIEEDAGTESRAAVNDKQEIDPRQIHINETMGNPNGTTTTASLELVVYPNPATELLIVQTGSSPAREISLIDISGRLVLTGSKESIGNSVRLDVGALPRGVYFVRVDYSGEAVIRKIMLT
jgi:hypothetical protein